MYNITCSDDGEYWKCCVKKNIRTSLHHLQTIWFPKNPLNGLYFNTCTYGADKTDAVPCDHTAAVGDSSGIFNVTPVISMLIWWRRDQCHLQFFVRYMWKQI